MITQEIYEHYAIPPHLQLHMLRVAAVMKKMCEHRQGEPIDTEALITAALIHDLGNIVKITFDGPLLHLLEGQDIQQLKKTKAEFISRYGANDHEANNIIAKELGVSEKVCKIIDAIAFNNLYTFQLPEMRHEILMIHADGRVGPLGIMSTEERLAEAAERYSSKGDAYLWLKQKAESVAIALSQEKKLFSSMVDLKAEDITDSSIQEDIELLRHYDIATSNHTL